VKAERYQCERCGESLAPGKEVWLELNTYTGRYHDPDKDPVPESESQGGFTFGPACAKAVLKNGGKNTRIRGRWKGTGA
jgi:hypothetical protein